MTISDRQLDQLRLGELGEEETTELLRQLEEAGEMGRLDDLIVDAEAYLEHYPAGPAVQQIRAALRRAQRQPDAPKPERRTSPAIFAAAGVALSGMLILFVFAQPSPPQTTAAAVDSVERSFIQWDQGDIDCVGNDACRAAALASYEAGKQLAANKTEDPANPYEAYKQFDRARRLLERGEVTSVPDSMLDIDERAANLKVQLDAAFKQRQVNFRNFRTRKMYPQMAQELREAQTLFPDRRCLYNQWAVEKEREMKDDAVYPIATD